MSRLKLAASALAGLLFAGIASAQVQRTFVASYGNDANAATNCGFTNPCRGFTAAHAVTTSGGEIVALDAAGYGAITITKSITITSNSGFYAGISASTGNAITIATADVNVVLRGLNINGIGATNGISMTDGASLVVENCVISNFAQRGIVITSPTGATLRVANTVLRGTAGHSAAIWVQDNILADISNTKIMNNAWVGLWVFPQAAGSSTVMLSDSVVSGCEYCIDALGTPSSARIIITRSSVSGALTSAVTAEGGTISIGSSTVSGNPGWGLANGGGTFESQGNNLVRQNGTNTVGVITSTPGI